MPPPSQQKSLHQILGGGKAADLVLWRNKKVSGGLVAGISVLWFIFEVVEYQFVKFLCQISILAMIVVFLWSHGAALSNRVPPEIPEVILSEKNFKEAALLFHAKYSRFISRFYDIARGKDYKQFILAISYLWIGSKIGGFCSTLSLLYIGFMCTLSLPVLYERYKNEVGQVATKGISDIKELYNKFYSKVLLKIPGAKPKEVEDKFK